MHWNVLLLFVFLLSVVVSAYQFCSFRPLHFSNDEGGGRSCGRGGGPHCPSGESMATLVVPKLQRPCHASLCVHGVRGTPVSGFVVGLASFSNGVHSFGWVCVWKG